jgi:hypothetical protein
MRTGLGFFLLLMFSAAATAQQPETDPHSGMIIDQHWELVNAHCTVCHSARQITQQRGSRETWLHLIRWMQEEQGLWQFDTDTENNILDYLEKNYAPSASYRRAPLSPDLLPKAKTTSN